MARSSSGIRLSAPSSEKLLAPTNFFWMNSSKMTASVSLVRMRSCSSRVSCDAVLGALHAVLQPLPDLQVVDVHELHADRTAVGVAQRLRISRRVSTRAPKMVRLEELAIEISAGQAVKLGVELGLVRAGQAERIDLRDHVTAHAVGAHQCVHLILPHGGFGHATHRSGAVAVAIPVGVTVHVRLRMAVTARVEDELGLKLGPSKLPFTGCPFT